MGTKLITSPHFKNAGSFMDEPDHYVNTHLTV